MIHWHIGCSGFHYSHWKGPFYPEHLPQRKWFEHYCRYFRSLELNITFYRFPRVSFLNKWYQSSPPDFSFAVKAPRVITHFKKFNDSSRYLSDFYGTCREGLKEKLGCVLFQLPPNYTYSETRLEKLISGVDPSFANVFEFRHESWWNPIVFERFRENQISFCGLSHPELPDQIIGGTPLLYYRLHGKGELYASNYSTAELERFVQQVQQDSKVQEAFIFFNNDIHAYAVANALETISIAESYTPQT